MWEKVALNFDGNPFSFPSTSYAKRFCDLFTTKSRQIIDRFLHHGRLTPEIVFISATNTE